MPFSRGHRWVLHAPLDDLVELLSGQEAGVLPEFPQSALELLLVLVLQSLLLPLLSGAAALLPVVQPEEGTFKTLAAALNSAAPGRSNRYSHFHDLWREQLQRDGFLLLEDQPSVSDRSAVDHLQDILGKLLWPKAKVEQKKTKPRRVWLHQSHLWHRPGGSLGVFGLSGVWKAAILLAGG